MATVDGFNLKNIQNIKYIKNNLIGGDHGHYTNLYFGMGDRFELNWGNYCLVQVAINNVIPLYITNANLFSKNYIEFFPVTSGKKYVFRIEKYIGGWMLINQVSTNNVTNIADSDISSIQLHELLTLRNVSDMTNNSVKLYTGVDFVVNKEMNGSEPAGVENDIAIVTVAFSGHELNEIYKYTNSAWVKQTKPKGLCVIQVTAVLIGGSGFAIGYYKSEGDSFTSIVSTTPSNWYITPLKDVNNNFYNHVQNVKLITSGNFTNQIDSTLNELVLYRNTSTNQYNKVLNLNLDFVEKVLAGIYNIENINFDLVDLNNNFIIMGLKYKSYTKIDSINYAFIFEYSTQIGNKLLLVTTEKQMNVLTPSYNFYPEFNLNYTNINATDDNVPPVSYKLLNSTFFDDSLMSIRGEFNVKTNNNIFAKNCIRRNRILKRNCYYITNAQIDAADLGYFTDETINNITYKKFSVINNSGVRDDLIAKYNIKNILIKYKPFYKTTSSLSVPAGYYEMDAAGRLIDENNNVVKQIVGPDGISLREIGLFLYEFGDVGDFSVSPIIYYSRFNGSKININEMEMIESPFDRDFSDVDVNWVGNNWTVSGGHYNHTASAENAILNTALSVLDEYYLVTVTVTTATIGNFTISYGGYTSNNLGGATTTNTHQFVIKSNANNTKLTLTPDANWVGYIDNVSIKNFGINLEFNIII